MSLSGTPWSDPILEPCTSCLDQEMFTQEQLGQIFAAHKTKPTFSPANSEALDGLDLHYDSSLSLANSPNLTTASSTPSISDYSHYTLSQQASPAYPTPGPHAPNPYRLQLQQSYDSYPHRYPQELAQRPLPTHFQTYSSIYPQQPYPHTQQPPHRRSFSHADADCFAARTQPTPDPVFFRLQVPRSRSATPEDNSGRLKRRPNAYENRHVSGTTHQGPMHMRVPANGGVDMPTSAPMDNSIIQRILLSTNTGTPLSESGHHDVGDWRGSDIQMTDSGPKDSYFMYMSREEQMKTSHRIIQVGAMAVLNRLKESPSRTISQPFPQQTPIHASSQRENLFRKLEQAESSLKQDLGDGHEDCVRVCSLTHESWTRNSETGVGEGKQSVRDEPVSDNGTVAPSAIFTKEDNELYIDTNEEDLFTLMAREMRDEGRIDLSGL